MLCTNVSFQDLFNLLWELDARLLPNSTLFNARPTQSAESTHWPQDICHHVICLFQSLSVQLKAAFLCSTFDMVLETQRSSGLLDGHLGKDLVER